MLINQQRDDRSAVRALARRHPTWSNTRIGRELGKTKARVYKRGRARDLKQLKKRIVKDLQDPFWTSWCESAFASMHQRMVDVFENV